MSDPALRFQIDRRLPVFGLVAILIQAGGLIWWTSDQNNKLQNSLIRLSAVETSTKDFNTVVYRLGKVEESQGRIEDKLEQIAEKVR